MGKNQNALVTVKTAPGPTTTQLMLMFGGDAVRDGSLAHKWFTRALEYFESEEVSDIELYDILGTMFEEWAVEFTEESEDIIEDFYDAKVKELFDAGVAMFEAS